MGGGLKLCRVVILHRPEESHPVWVCGLKLNICSIL